MIRTLLRALGRLVGLHVADYNYVIPVFRRKGFHRWGRRYFWTVPFLERALPPIYTGVNTAFCTIPDVTSLDNIPFTFEVKVRFMFTPDRQLSNKQVTEQLINLSKSVSNLASILSIKEGLEAIVHDHVGDRLRCLASKVEAERMGSHATRVNFKHDLVDYLRNHLRYLSLTFTDDAVLLQSIKPDAKFTHTMLNIEQHQATLRTLGDYLEKHEKVLKMLEEHKEALKLIDKMTETEFFDSLEDRQGEVQIGSFLDIDYLHRSRGGDQEAG